jgi:small subunit ribosomal protein S16
MVKIRLRRVGAKKQPSYRVVVADSRSPRDGRFIETIGHYNPRTDPPTVVIHEDRAIYWLGVGAQPSDAVAHFFRQLGLEEKVQQVRAGAKVEDVAAPRAGKAAAPAAEAKAKPAKAKAEKPAEAKAEKPAEAKAAEPAAEAVAEPVAAVEEVAEAATEPTAAVEEVAPAAVAEEAAAEPEAVADEAAEAVADSAAEPAAEASGDLASLGLSHRVQTALEAAGITTLAELTAKAAEGDDALIALPGIGAKAAEEIHEKLAGH